MLGKCLARVETCFFLELFKRHDKTKLCDFDELMVEFLSSFEASSFSHGFVFACYTSYQIFHPFLIFKIMPNHRLVESWVKVGKGDNRKLVESGPAVLDEKVLGASH